MKTYIQVFNWFFFKKTSFKQFVYIEKFKKANSQSNIILKMKKIRLKHN